MILISRKFQEEEPVFAGASRILSDTGSSDTLTVVVDAGHGGKDQGTNSQDILEKDVNLSVARLLAKKLEKAGCHVIYGLVGLNSRYLYRAGRTGSTGK